MTLVLRYIFILQNHVRFEQKIENKGKKSGADSCLSALALVAFGVCPSHAFSLRPDTFLRPYLLSRSPVYLIPDMHACRRVSECEVVQILCFVTCFDLAMSHSFTLLVSCPENEDRVLMVPLEPDT